MKSDAILARSCFAAATLLALIEPALAHTGTDTVFGFKTGFLHPISGPDHLVAMVAVGLWGAQLGAPAIWILPITFPLVMAMGGVLGVIGVPVPFVETVIALSAVALGLVVALRLRPPLWAAAALVAVFAIFHGYAHGRELPGRPILSVMASALWSPPASCTWPAS